MVNKLITISYTKNSKEYQISKTTDEKGLKSNAFLNNVLHLEEILNGFVGRCVYILVIAKIHNVQIESEKACLG